MLINHRSLYMLITCAALVKHVTTTPGLRCGVDFSIRRNYPDPLTCEWIWGPGDHRGMDTFGCIKGFHIGWAASEFLTRASKF